MRDVWVSPHAIKRYRERVDSSLTDDEVIAAIVADVKAATSRREHGQVVEVTGARPRRLRYRIGPPEKPGGLPVVVTVIARDPWA